MYFTSVKCMRIMASFNGLDDIGLFTHGQYWLLSMERIQFEFKVKPAIYIQCRWHLVTPGPPL